MRKFFTLIVMTALPCTLWAEQWSLNDCIRHAMEKNISIQKSRIVEEQGENTLKQRKSSLWPSLFFSTNQNMTAHALQSDETVRTSEGTVISSSNKVTYSGNYSIQMNWTVWDGGINRKNVASQELQNKIDALSTHVNENSIQENIAHLYVSILYSREAMIVNEKIRETAKKQWERGQIMMEQGQMSRADVVQLEAQYAAADYNVLNSKTSVDQFKRQLKELLQLDLTTDFDVKDDVPADEKALAIIPTAQEVYAEALAKRPEIRMAQLGIEKADVTLDIAKRGYYPTISINAGISDNHVSTHKNDYATQLKENFSIGAGVSVSVPLWDQRKTKTNIENAKLGITSSRLDLEDKKKALSSTIEQLWLNATSNQQKFRAAEVKVKSQKESDELVNEQFNNGLKHVVDVLQSRDNRLQAEQDKLESKYTTLLNAALLKFYKGEDLTL